MILDIECLIGKGPRPRRLAKPLGRERKDEPQMDADRRRFRAREITSGDPKPICANLCQSAVVFSSSVFASLRG